MIKYQHFALDNLFLTNGYHETNTDSDIEREYEREDELEQCIRLLVLRKPEPLRGWDLRFLRRGLELSQADFGGMVDRDAQTVARWEKSAEIVPKFVDLMIRARFAERFEPKIKLTELLSFIDGSAPALPMHIQLSLTSNGWEFDFGSHTILPPIKGLSNSIVALPIGHGTVQTVSYPIFLTSDHPDHNASLEKAAQPVIFISERRSGSNLVLLSTASGKVPALLPKHTIQGFYNEQKLH